MSQTLVMDPYLMNESRTNVVPKESSVPVDALALILKEIPEMLYHAAFHHTKDRVYESLYVMWMALEIYGWEYETAILDSTIKYAMKRVKEWADNTTVKRRFTALHSNLQLPMAQRLVNPGDLMFYQSPYTAAIVSSAMFNLGMNRNTRQKILHKCDTLLIKHGDPTYAEAIALHNLACIFATNEFGSMENAVVRSMARKIKNRPYIAIQSRLLYKDAIIPKFNHSALYNIRSMQSFVSQLRAFMRVNEAKRNEVITFTNRIEAYTIVAAIREYNAGIHRNEMLRVINNSWIRYEYYEKGDDLADASAYYGAIADLAVSADFMDARQYILANRNLYTC